MKKGQLKDSKTLAQSSKPAGITVELKDISLAGRILAAFPEHLTQVACYCKRILGLQLYR